MTAGPLSGDFCLLIVFLVHRHFDISADETIVEWNDEDNRKHVLLQVTSEGNLSLNCRINPGYAGAMNVAARRPVQGTAKPGAAATPSPLFRSGVRPAPAIYPVGPLMIWTSTCLPFSMRKWP
jgi:hypothetical protein